MGFAMFANLCVQIFFTFLSLLEMGSYDETLRSFSSLSVVNNTDCDETR